MNGTQKKAIAQAIKANPEDYNLDLEPQVLTDKAEIKIVPCRSCQRPCVVTRFATAAKTACLDCRDRQSAPTKLREFDESKEEHVLTDRDKTKRVPCRSCGRPCIVTTFATPEKVACKDCRKYVPRPTRRVDYQLDASGLDGEKRYVRKERVEIYDADELQKSIDAMTKPSLPFWPEGTDEDRAELLALTLAEYEADQEVANQRAIFREEQYLPWKSSRKLVGDQWKPEQPVYPEALTGALEDRNIARSRRTSKRQEMVRKLEDAGSANPHADVPGSEGTQAARRLNLMLSY